MPQTSLAETLRLAPALAAGLALTAAAGARAEPYAILAFSAQEGISVADTGSVARTGPLPRAMAYVILPERPPQRVFLEASQIEFDCAQGRMRVVSTVRYDDKDQPVAKSDKPAAWERARSGSPAGAMHRQVCAGEFNPAFLRGQGQDIFAFSKTMRPILAQLKD